jgi:GNAT superfamily N-acetyltransferase
MESEDLVIRLATERDIDKLTDVCRICFPELARWRGPRNHSRKWWRMLLNVDYCEIWVCENGGELIGFTELTFDKARYTSAWVKHQPSFLAVLYIFATCPRLFVAKIREKLKKNTAKSSEKLSIDSSSNEIQEKTSKDNGLLDSKMPWIGPSAIMPGMRGKGVSTKIHEYCFQRARSLGYKEIYSVVDRKNMMSRVMVAILGFVVVKETADILFYKKTLEAGHDTRVDSTR